MPEAKKGKENQQAPHPTPKQQQQQKLQKITTYTGIGVLVVVAAIVSYYLLSSRAPTANPTPQTVDYHLDQQPSLGDPKAPIKVVEFGDFKCPACKAFETEVFPQLKQDYIDTGQVEFFFINFPLPIGDDSFTAAYAAECVYHQNEAAFWAYYRTVYEYQGQESQTWATPDFLLSLVQQHVQPLADVNTTELQKCIAEKRYQKEVEADKQMGVTAGISGTPAIFINKKQAPWWPYANIKSAIEKELKNQTP